MADKPNDPANPFLTKEELIAHLKGSMFPKGKAFAPSLVMWGDPHGEEVDLDHLDHMEPPEEGNASDG
ncbi:hypothetical protein [Erythrobacter sp. Alg231-14]|uniref:hypothetical protein n=1 Tax=Erythrobacter sp. Alg231-14 TaxID=1922225 RepID=UPI000D557EE1